MNKHTVTILVLCFSGAILAALVAGSYMTQPAHASASSVSNSDYVMGTVSISATTECVTVIDTNARKMIVYRPDNKTGSPTRIDIVNTVDLGRAFPDRPAGRR